MKKNFQTVNEFSHSINRKNVTSSRFIGHMSKRAYLYYPTNCDEEIPQHICDPCETQEHGRIRGVAYIHKSYAFADPTDPSEWQSAIAAGHVIVIPKTNGSYDGGTPIEGPGYGDSPTTYIGSNFSATYKDPNYQNNCGFYNGLKRSRNFKFAYLTETKVHITNKTVTVLPKNPVADDITSLVEWEVNVKWVDKDFACSYDIPEGIFECFIVE